MSTTPNSHASPRLRAPAELLADRRTVYLALVAAALAVAAGFVAQGLTRLIGLITNLCFHGRVSTSFASPAGNSLGLYVVLVPVAGALIVGLMARYGSKAIRGHGIPEAMEQVLENESRIPARLIWLKPISAAISIGTGGPFGAEGPIIATGGALGSVMGQVLSVTAAERKILLAAGAAAGMSATFGSPVSAVLLAVELLLFEYRARSLIPVALAATVAAGVRLAFVSAPAFAMTALAPPTTWAIAGCIAVGALVGVMSVYITRLVYAVEDAFDRLPMHWMWWPALGAVAVGVVGYFAPRTMGVGYDNIDAILSGDLTGRALFVLCALKLVSWSISLGSGTSGGTLAPLFTIGGGLGALLGAGANVVVPGMGLDARLAALVGMASMFAGASRAVLASVVFAFETTREPHGVLPLLGGCIAAYLVSCLMMRTTIMTEKIDRRGVRALAEYAVDHLARISLDDVARRTVQTLSALDSLTTARAWLHSDGAAFAHQAFPVVDGEGTVVGVITRRQILASTLSPDAKVRELLTRPPVTVDAGLSLRDAADLMARENIGRLPVVSGRKLVGIVTRSDLLAAHTTRLTDDNQRGPGLALPH